MTVDFEAVGIYWRLLRCGLAETITSFMFSLVRIKRSDPRILSDMAVHYSHPKGFVGRNICYAIMVGAIYYGAIVGGSSTLHLVGRDKFFGITTENKKEKLVQIVNNIFYHIEKKNGRYPIRNMVPAVLRAFRERISLDWKEKYGDTVVGFESLIELPRTGEAYRRDGWIEVGVTKFMVRKKSVGHKKSKTEKSVRPKCKYCGSSNTQTEHWDSGATCGPMGRSSVVICRDCGTRSNDYSTPY